MNTQPDTHTVDASEAQVAYLNRLSDASKQYRMNLRYLKKMAEDELSASFVSNLDHQTISAVQRWNGAVGELLQMKHFIFADFPKDRVSEVNDWIRLAREENPNGVMGVNWFLAAKNKD